MLTIANRSWKATFPQIPDVKVTPTCNVALMGHCHWCCSSRLCFNCGFLGKANAYKNGSWQCPSAAVRVPEGSCRSGCSPLVSCHRISAWLCHGKLHFPDHSLVIGISCLRCSAGRGSSAGVLQPGDKPVQHSHHGLSDAFLPLFPAGMSLAQSPQKLSLHLFLFLKPHHCSNKTFSVISCTVSTW